MKKDGGQAFPMHDLVWKGMTLRDFFAATALQGLLGDPKWNPKGRDIGAKIAYDWADAMLAERDKS